MKIAFVVNDVQTERADYTTTLLHRTAVARGHDAWSMGVTELSCEPTGAVCARAHAVDEPGQDPAAFLAALRSGEARTERLCLDELDVLMLRYDPASEAIDRPWAQAAGVLFAQLACDRGVIVLNDPHTLADALNKTYFQQFPELVRPRTLISRDPEQLRAFVRGQGDRAVLKPLQGSGGKNVFVVGPETRTNLNQMIEAIARDGYVVAQEYLPEATQGDLRLFLINGAPLVQGGVYAAVRRVAAEGDARSNITAGGHAEPAEVDERVLRLAEVVRPKLIKDGMFFVGLDVVGDKLMEVNVFSPGALDLVEATTGVDFTVPILEALERKVAYRAHYREGIGNLEFATL